MQNDTPPPSDTSAVSASEEAPVIENAAADSGNSPLPPPYVAPAQSRVSNLTGMVQGSSFLRMLGIAFTALLLFIPLNMVDSLVRERSYLQQDVVRDIALRWGGEQRVCGPALYIPYTTWEEHTERVYNKKKDVYDTVVTRIKSARQYKVLLPQLLDYTSIIKPEERQFGIYAYTVYESPIAISGKFKFPLEADFDIDIADVHWEDAVFNLGVSGLRYTAATSGLRWQEGEAITFSPGTSVGNLLGSGIHAKAPVVMNAERVYSFSVDLTLKGSRLLYFSPVGETTTINVSGKWKDPSYKGDLSPSSRSVDGDTFKAQWSIPHLSRSYPQFGSLSDYSSSDITGFVTGVDLFEPITLYTLVERSMKYAILFIGFTFMALFGFELARKERLHYLQYGLVGVSMSVFYLTLLALAEYTLFSTSFAVAAAVTILMNSLYIAAVMKSIKQGFLLCVILSLLYGALYILLHMEAPLLVGTALVLIAIAVMMYLTRNLPVAGSAAGKTA